MPNCKNQVLPAYAPCPCYKCKDRHTGCHDQCDKYQDYKQKYQKVKIDVKNQELVENHDDKEYSHVATKTYT